MLSDKLLWSVLPRSDTTVTDERVAASDVPEWVRDRAYRYLARYAS